MIVYRIKQKSSELYLKGTPLYPDYDNKGRIFSKLSQVRSFLTLSLKIPRRRDELSNWIIVSYRLQVDQVCEVHEIVKAEKILEILKQ